MDFDRYLKGIEDGTLDWQRHLVPQVTYVIDAEGKLLVDEILPFESLNSAFCDMYERRHGKRPKLRKANASADRSDYRTFYDDAGIEIIANAYRRDIERFGYRFD
jgi:hypothetical protein